MKKAMIILLVATLAMAAVFANEPSGPGFCFKVDLFGTYGTYRAAFTVDRWEIGLGYQTYTPGHVLEFFFAAKQMQWDTTDTLKMFFEPLGIMANLNYRVVATAEQDVAVFLTATYDLRQNFTMHGGAGIEYALCIDEHNAITADAYIQLYPFSIMSSISTVNFGYRVSF